MKLFSFAPPVFCLLLLGALFVSSPAAAQGPPTPTLPAFLPEMIQGPDLLLYAGTSGQVDSSALSLAGIVIMTLPDMSQVDSIHVRLGTSSGGNELFGQAFSPHAATRPGPHQAYRRVGSRCILRIGLFSLLDLGAPLLYLEVKTEDGNGVLSAAASHSFSL